MKGLTSTLEEYEQYDGGFYRYCERCSVNLKGIASNVEDIAISPRDIVST